MYNFLTQHKKAIKIIIWSSSLSVTALLIYFAPNIFKNENVYFYTSSTIAQGFIALVAFLGSVVVFKVQLEDQAMQKLSDGIEFSVAFYHGSATKTYTPTQMMNACKEILAKENENYGNNKDLMKKISDKMTETLASRGETRNKMVDFAIVSFLNVSVAMISLLFTPILAKSWYVGGILLSANVYFSIFSLSRALGVVKSTMGYSFSLSIEV